MRRTAGGRSLIVLGVALILSGEGGRDDPGLVDAARKADWDVVRSLLEEGADVNAAAGDGSTPLQWASYWDDLQSVDLLIRAGADVNAPSDLGVTPLWSAAENGSAAVAQRLLDAVADPNAALLSGETPVMTAARGGHVDVVKLLVARGADVEARASRGQTALMWAAAQRHAEVVEVLLAHGADVHARSDERRQFWQKGTSWGAHDDDKLWIQEGGFTPLLFAARVGDLATAKTLVSAGADVNDQTAAGISATTLAVHSVHERFGYFPQQARNISVAPAGALLGSPHVYPLNDAEELVEFLLKQSADPDADSFGYAALHVAILRGSERMVRALLAHGADPNAVLRTATRVRRNAYDFFFDRPFVGATPFWLAARFGQPDIMRLLAEHGADPLVEVYVEYRGGGPEYQSIREGATTALMAAVEMPRGTGFPFQQPVDRAEAEALRLQTVKLAVELGVDVNAANANGQTAIDAARDLGYDSIVTFLEENGA